MKKVHIIGGGTTSKVSCHLSLAAMAYGQTARTLAHMYELQLNSRMEIKLHLTKMANGGMGNLDTHEDMRELVRRITGDLDTRIIVFNPAMVDFKVEGSPIDGRLSSSESINFTLTPYDKIVGEIRKTRKDIFLVAFKTVYGGTKEEQFGKGLSLLKKTSSNIVMVNDLHPDAIKNGYNNFLVTPEESSYTYQTRHECLEALVDMSIKRSHLAFTRSNVVSADSVPWSSDLIPESLRKVVDHCVAQDAYKVFNKATCGHFASKLNSHTFLTSIRKTNFNQLKDIGLVKVITDDPDDIYGYKHFFEDKEKDSHVVSFGAKPSVGGQTQRSIFEAYPELDCIVHFHCPLKVSGSISTTPQFGAECGSHGPGSCAENTIQNLVKYELSNGQYVYAVHLDYHGPNIVFNKDVDPDAIIEFIEKNWNLKKKTTGLHSDLR